MLGWTYRLADLMAHGLEHLRIPRVLWGCDTEGFMPVRVLASYLGLERLQSLCPITSQPQRQAFMWGVWDGLVATVGAVPELLRLTRDLPDPHAWDAAWAKIRAFQALRIVEGDSVLCDSGEIARKIGYILRDGALNLLNDPCEAAHLQGEIAAPILLAIASNGLLSGTALGVAGEYRPIAAILRFLTFCDRFGDITTYAGRIGRGAVVLARRVGRLRPEVRVGRMAVLRGVDDEAVELLRLGEPPRRIPLDELDNHAEEVRTALREAADATPFADPEKEARYQQYLERKRRKGQAPRERQDWEEMVYGESAMNIARGNAFNDKALKSRWYRYNEIHLENGCRLDSYDPEIGEIVSRKATDLDAIAPETLEGYLREFETKYRVGTIIKSKKRGYENIYDTKLRGRYILEIPESNRQSPRIGEYIKRAEKHQVTIRFRPE